VLTVEVGEVVDGVVQTVFVKEGEIVSKGAKLAEIGCPDLQSCIDPFRVALDYAHKLGLQFHGTSTFESVRRIRVEDEALLDLSRWPAF